MQLHNAHGQNVREQKSIAVTYDTDEKKSAQVKLVAKISVTFFAAFFCLCVRCHFSRFFFISDEKFKSGTFLRLENTIAAGNNADFDIHELKILLLEYKR